MTSCCRRRTGTHFMLGRVGVLISVLMFAASAWAIKPMPPVEVAIQADDAALTAAGSGTVTFRVIPEVDVEQAYVEFAVVTGDVVITGPTSATLGRLASGQTYTSASTVQVTGQGASEIRGTVHGLDAAGSELFWRSTAVLLGVSGSEVASGTAGLIPVRLEAIKRNSSAGNGEKSSRDKEIERVLTGGAVENRQVTEGGAKAGNITIEGKILWTDGAGATHPARYVDVEIYDENIVPDELVTTLTAGYDGSYSTVVENSDTYGLNGRDIYVKPTANSSYARVVGPGAAPRTVQSLKSSTTNDVPDGSTLTIDLTANNTDDNNRAFSVHDALVTITSHAAYLTGSYLPKIDTIFPTTRHTSLYDGTDLNILRDDWIDWDVTHHEFGHYFMDFENIENNPGGKHSSKENLAERVGKDTGIRLAWGEGFPTYFGVSGQAQQGAASLSVPNVGDTTYTDTIDAAINYDLENNSAPKDRGEDNELSVLRILYDLYDTAPDGEDKVALGDYSVFSTALSANATTLSAFWNQLISGASMLDQVRYGCLFMDHMVSPEPKAPADGAEFAAADPPPDFDWEKRGAGPTYLLNKFTLEFWNEDFTALIFTSPEVNGPKWTPSNAEWATILGGADVVKWVVKGRNTSAPETGTYISCARTIGGVDIAFVIDDTGSMSEEIGGVRSALTGFISSLAATGGSVKINLITFKDAPSSLIITEDLPTLQTYVDALYADGGGDCPEASVEALDLAAQNVKAGGRILFATDADPHSGLDLAGTIAALRAKGIRVDVLLTASCSESFKSGTFFTTSTGERFLIPPQCNEADCAGMREPVKTQPVGTSLEAAPDHGETDQGKGDVDCDDPDCDTPTIPPAVYPAGAIAVFSAIAAETGGIFAFVPDVNTGGLDGAARFAAVALSVMEGVLFPTIPDVNPPRGNLGATTNLRITGSGTNFNASSELAFSGAGITVNSGGATSATTFEANITVAPDAALGFRNVTVTTTLGGSTETASGEGIFMIEGAPAFPSITSASPAVGALGTTQDVTITGFNTHFDATSTPYFGAGITVNSFTPISPTEGIADITIDEALSTLGYHNVTVTTGAEYAYELVTGPFQVVSKDLASGIARILSLAPKITGPGTSIVVHVVGENTNFENGVSVAAFSGAGITVTETAVTSPTEADVHITIAADAPEGFRDVSITTGSEVAAILDGFEIGNEPPTADAGPDQLIAISGTSTVATLDGSGSSDSDGTIAEYAWEGTPNPGDVAQPTVTLGPGAHTFTLIVRDNDGAYSAPDTVTITVRAAPVADAGPDQTVTAVSGSADVTLDGSASSDADGTIAGYMWTGSPDPDDVVQPVLTLSPGVYTFTLAVKDNDDIDSAPDAVTITVNAPPIADAGPDQTVKARGGTASVTLDGSGSSDPDGAIAGYTWSGAPDPDDTSGPSLMLAPGTYTFTLVIRDNLGADSAPDTVTIVVERGGLFGCYGGLEQQPKHPAASGSGDALLISLAAGLLLLGKRRLLHRANVRR